MTGTVAVILGAGAGERLGADVPKAFISVGGRAMLAIAMAAAADSLDVDALVVTVPSGWEEQVDLEVGKPVTVVVGGATRQESVRRALAAVGDAEWVLVHDAARCLASPSLFDRVASGLKRPGVEGVVPVVPVADTIKRVRDGIVVGTVDRAELGAAQTPQGFRTGTLAAVHARALAQGRTFTDDAGMLERAGHAVIAVEGEENNFKITTPADLDRARILVGAMR